MSGKMNLTDDLMDVLFADDGGIAPFGRDIHIVSFDTEALDRIEAPSHDKQPSHPRHQANPKKFCRR